MLFHLPGNSFFNITNPSLILALWDLTLAIPLSLALTHLNKHIFRFLGYEKFMRSPGGARLSQAIFLLVNIWLVVGWAWQLMDEAKGQREENVRKLKEEIKFWDGEIERLEGLLEEKMIQEQLTDGKKNKGAARMVVVNGDIRLARLGSPFEMKRHGLGVESRGSRAPSPLKRSQF